MTMTWADLRSQIVSLGFEEDSITEEYEDIILDSVNLSLDILFHTVVPEITDYYKATKTWGEEDEHGKWVFPDEEHITEETADDYEIVIPENLQPLLPLLASHYVWLDDDIEKATMHWNEYDQLKDQIIQTCKRPRNATIIGGIGW